MALILDKRCEMCGAQLDIDADGRKAECRYCGSKYTYVRPVTAESAGSINRANNYRLKNMFDNAIVEYKTLLQNEEFAENAEVWWGLLISEFGIEYVHDTRDDVYVPTCHRTLTGSIFDSPYYKNAIKFATDEMKTAYARMAAEIDELQTAIKAQAELISDYEVFICFKSTDNRAATEDRYIARKIFDELTKRGFCVFFSEVSLKGRLGTEYEPIIYKALTTAKVMLLVCTDEKYLDAPFVKNEWSRFKARKKEDPSLSLIPVFRNVGHASLPTKEQGIDLDKYPAGGYEVDIADNLESVLGKRAVPKIDREILEEYSRYNEINKVKFEKEYKNALRDVDLSYKRTKCASKEFIAKAEEMETLGDYKNAAVLAEEYRKDAAFFAEREKAEQRRTSGYNVAGLLLSVVLTVSAIFLMTLNAGSDMTRPNPDLFIVVCVLTGISVGLCLVFSFMNTFINGEMRNVNVIVKYELYVYSIAAICMIVPVLINLTCVYDAEGINSTIFYFALQIGIILIFFLNLAKRRQNMKFGNIK